MISVMTIRYRGVGGHAIEPRCVARLLCCARPRLENVYDNTSGDRTRVAETCHNDVKCRTDHDVAAARFIKIRPNVELDRPPMKPPQGFL
jgi:hypothetical protein